MMQLFQFMLDAAYDFFVSFVVSDYFLAIVLLAVIGLCVSSFFGGVLKL